MEERDWTMSQYHLLLYKRAIVVAPGTSSNSHLKFNPTMWPN